MSQPEPKLSDVLAQKRTDLAVERTNLSIEGTLMGAERTLMAWARTGLSMIGFGFTLYKVLKAMLQEGVRITLSANGPRYLGLFLIGLGALSIFMGCLEYVSQTRRLRKKFGSAFRKYPLVMSGLIFLIGLWLFVGIVLNAEYF